MAESYKIAIIGSGPAGLSAASHAADCGLSHILIESESAVANTVRKFQRGKFVMAEPSSVPLRSSVPFAATTREKVLKSWEEVISNKKLNFRPNAKVTAISGSKGNFTIQIAGSKPVCAEYVILAIGLQGNLRKLGIPGEELPMVQYQLDDPEAFVDETILVVGAGDAGVENALALAEKNRVILINRRDEFARCKEANYELLNEAVESFMIETRLGTQVTGIHPIKDAGFSLLVELHTPDGNESIACHRLIARLGADPPRKLIEKFGVTFPSEDPSATPCIFTGYESARPGLHIIGALAGQPLIKHALNQGYEVIEYIEGSVVEPADELFLKQKLSLLDCEGEVEQKIAFLLEKTPVLRMLSTLQVRSCLLESELLKISSGTTIYNKNDFSNDFYSVIDGEVTLSTIDATNPIKLEAGCFFGESGLAAGRRRIETAVSGTDVLLLKIPRRIVLGFVNENESLRKRLDTVSLKRAILEFFDFPIAEDLMDALLANSNTIRLSAGDTLFNEGDTPDGFFYVRHGSLTVSQTVSGKERVLSFLASGRFIGEQEFLSNQPRISSVRATSDAELDQINADFVKLMLSENSELKSHFEKAYFKRRGDLQRDPGKHKLATLASPDFGHSTGLVNFMMQQGLGEATDALLIDYNLCIRCDMCESVCASTHGGFSRLKRAAGSTYENIHIPSACRHCEIPYCMKDCPPGAISRSSNGEVYIEDTCIGCGNCVNNCPYGVIQLAPPPKPMSARMSLLEFVRDLALGKEPLTDKGPVSHKIAVKCDMCKDFQHGPACVRYCPTGAAKRVDPEDLILKGIWKNAKG